MADDIDIEEHDILDNPTVRKIFPDLSIIKKEISDYFEEDEKRSEVALPQAQVKLERTFEDDPRDVIELGTSLSVSSNISQKSDLLKSLNSVVQIPSTEIPKPIPVFQKAELFLNENKIILGSRPVTKRIEAADAQKILDNDMKSRVARIEIDDIRPFLNGSKRFCNKCLTLFPTQNTIRRHVAKIHESNPKPNLNKPKSNQIDSFNCNFCNVSFKCSSNLIIHICSIHTNKLNGEQDKQLPKNEIKISQKSSNLDTCKTCFHCSKLFGSEQSLIEHLYSVLERKEFVCDVCSCKFHDKELLIQHMIKHQTRKRYNNNFDIVHTQLSSKQKLEAPFLAKPEKKTLSNQNISINNASNTKKNNAFNKNAKSKVELRVKKLLGSKNIESQVTHKSNELKGQQLLYRCSICSFYSKVLKVCESHIVYRHKVISNVNSKIIQVTMFESKCKYCPSKCSYIQSYNKHLMKFHKEKFRENENKQSKAVQSITSKCIKKVNSILYRCSICSCYSTQKEKCLLHLTRRHSIVDKSKYTEVSKFDPKCQICYSKYLTLVSYNTHIQRSHEEHFNMKFIKSNTSNKHLITKKEKKDDGNLKNCVPADVKFFDITSEIPQMDVMILKSTVFKCSKCDVHFLSASAAVKHKEHIELLVNWKCSICNRIFKENHKSLHLKQHSYKNTLSVIELSENQLSRVMYNCIQCAVHFTEDNFIYHIPICGVQMPISKYCKLCDILIEKETMKFHENCHKIEKLDPNHFITIQNDVIMVGEATQDSTIERNTLNKNIEIKADSIESNKKVDNVLNTSQSIQKKPEGNELKHKKLKKLPRTKYYQFLSSLSLSYCDFCQCHIITNFRVHHINHSDSRWRHVRYVCKLCGLVFTNKSTTTHKMLHKKKPALTMQDFKFYDFSTDKLITPPIPKYPNCKFCGIHFISETDVKKHLCSEENYETCSYCNIKLSNSAFKLHMFYHKYRLNGENYDETPVSEIVASASIPETSVSEIVASAPIPIVSNNVQTSEQLFYLCKHCEIVFHMYDKVIEHCQRHFSHTEKMIKTEVCSVCKMKVENSYYKIHESKHKDYEIFNVLKFDPYFFSLDESVWVKHLFANIPGEQINEIMKTSIYNEEKRIKFEILQDGPPDLTVYKCDKCQSIIESIAVYHHTLNCTSKAKQFFCSICGLLFYSMCFKTTHEKIHNKYPNVTIKSYRILLFNREMDSIFNKGEYSASKYVLFQCRNCDGIVDKAKLKCHTCNSHTLTKCIHCGLMIQYDDHSNHTSKHTEYGSFNLDNMKVILFGKRLMNAYKGESKLSFKGLICDYTLYQCLECRICEINQNNIKTHVCQITESAPKCEICRYRCNEIMKHKNDHATDPDFLKDYINVVQFEPQRFSDKENNRSKTEHSNQNNTGLEKTDGSKKDFSLDSKKDGSFKTEISGTAEEKVVLIYKCPCGLHFLDETGVNIHLTKKCGTKAKISRQKCSKCDLYFTPEILFKHLLAHHANKRFSFNYNIVEVLQNGETTCVTYYKCSICNLHFTQRLQAKEHILKCDKLEIGIYCDECNLSFHDSGNLHDHGTDKLQTKIVEIYRDEDTDAEFATKDEITNDDNMSALASIASLVTKCNYNISRENLLKIDLSQYSNIVYKCEICNVHFLNKDTTRKHLQKGKHDNSSQHVDKCNICSLTFTLQSLTRHMYIHHEKLGLASNGIYVEVVEYKLA